MSTETVPVQEAVEDPIIEQPVEVEQNTEVQAPEQKEEHVPLSALQKERRKRQELEQEVKWHRDMMLQQKQQSPAPDDSIYEAATKEDLGKVKQQVIRDVQESNWIKQNPEKASEINEKLAEFLKQRPNLAPAIEAATNRYEEAWMLMDALTPKQKAALKVPAQPKREAPGNPAAIPKAAGMNQAVDVMSMTDSEFNSWRKSQIKRR